MTMIIDLSVPVRNGAQEPDPPTIQYVDHAEGAQLFGKRYNLAPSDFRNGLYCAVESITLRTHTGTHVDAPWHYGPTSEGKPARTIDQMPLSWFFNDAVVLDFSAKPSGYGITEADVEAELARIGYSLKEGDIVLLRTDTLKRFGHLHNNWNMHPGPTRGAIKWLIDHGSKVIGIDAYALERTAEVMLKDLHAGMPERFWEAHYHGMEQEYCQIEKLFNLDALPRAFGFKVACFPVKVEGGSAGWTRAVAIFES
jgi:kynurenine formamidase